MDLLVWEKSTRPDINVRGVLINWRLSWIGPKTKEVGIIILTSLPKRIKKLHVYLIYWIAFYDRGQALTNQTLGYTTYNKL